MILVVTNRNSLSVQDGFKWSSKEYVYGVDNMSAIQAYEKI